MIQDWGWGRLKELLLFTINPSKLKIIMGIFDTNLKCLSLYGIHNNKERY